MMEQIFLQLFSETVREQVIQQKEVRIDGLGVFLHRHRKQYQKQHDDGRVVMMPPKDTLTFIPEKHSHGH